jgi:hypothetical protein
MAGHRSGNGRPRRDAARTARMRSRVDTAPDDFAAMNAAYDWLRFEVGHLGRSSAHGEVAGTHLPEARTAAREIADYLAGRAGELSKRGDAP